MASKKSKILLFLKTYQEVISDPEVTWKWPGSDRKWPGSEFGSDHKMSKFAFFVVHTYQEVTSNPDMNPEVTQKWTRKWLSYGWSVEKTVYQPPDKWRFLPSDFLGFVATLLRSNVTFLSDEAFARRTKK